jgi:hypothetical protein
MAERRLRRRATDEREWRGDMQGQEQEEEVSSEEKSDQPEAEKKAQDTPITPSSSQRSSNMSMIDPSEWSLEDAEEPVVVPDGTECRLRIVSVRKGQDKNKLDYWQPTLEIVDSPRAKDFTHFLSVPNRAEQQAKRYESSRWNLKEFMDAFQLDYTRPFNPTEDWPGNEGFAVLSVIDTPGFGKQNQIRALIRPR